MKEKVIGQDLEYAKKYLKSFFKLRLLKTKNINYPFWRFDKEKNNN